MLSEFIGVISGVLIGDTFSVLVGVSLVVTSIVLSYIIKNVSYNVLWGRGISTLQWREIKDFNWCVNPLVNELLFDVDTAP